MSTLPFLLSVADELDNINNQSYMDDFGLGFHPHRQYYRTPTIQLSLPAGTEWMEPEGSRHHHHSRYRSSYRYYGEPVTSLASPAENDEEDNEDSEKNGSSSNKHRSDEGKTGSSSSSSTAAQKYVSALNSNRHQNDNDEDKIDNSVPMFNLSKKCSKNYYRHPEPCTSSAAATSSMVAPPPLPPRSATSTSVGQAGTTKEKPSMSYRLHSKCLEGNNSSSEESLQKVTSSIEFLTCFLLKKSRVGKTSSGANASTTAASGSSAADSKKS